MTAPAHVSYSAMKAWKDCGERYRLERIAQVQQTPAWWFVGGKALHRATEMWDCAPEAYTDAEALALACFDEEIKDTAKTTDLPQGSWRFSKKEDPDWWRVNIPKMVENWIGWRETSGWRLLHLEGGPAVEVEINVTPEGGTTPLKQFIDRVFILPGGELVVVDLKSGARKPPSTEQLGAYRVGLGEQYGLKADLGAYWMARTGETTDLASLKHYKVARLAKDADMFQLAREQNLYLANPGIFCGTCSVRDYCYAVGGEKAGTA